MIDPAIIPELTRAIVAGRASDEARAAWDELRRDLCRAATMLVFRPAGADAAWRVQFEVGEDRRLTTFTPGSDGVLWLWRAVLAEPAGVLLADSTPEATRGLFRRGLSELDKRSPALANELRRGTICSGNAIIYTFAVNSPYIEARPICGQ